PCLEPNREAPQAIQMLDDFICGVGQRAIAIAEMAKLERTVAVAVVAGDLYVGYARLLCVLLGQKLADTTIAVFVVDGIDDELVFVGMIGERKQSKLANEPRRHILGNERFVLVVAHREVERLAPIGPGYVGEPFAIF